ncbi:ABC transporter permease [bacterium]|nr:ABC transporter permease [bacterium]
MMWSNYLRVGLRNLARHKGHTLINVIGLATGITVCLLIYLYLQREVTWNHHLADIDRSYRVIEKLVPESGEPTLRTIVTSLLRPSVDGAVPGIESMIRTMDTEVILRLEREGEVAEFQPTAFFADTTVFSFFGQPLLKGDPATALADMHGAVLTHSYAQQLFGDIDPIGQELQVELVTEERTYTVSGVVADPPSNSSLTYDLLLPYEVPYLTFRSRFGDHWRMAFGQSYIKLEPGVDPAVIEERIHDILVAVGEDQSDMAGARSYLLQPLNDIHMAFDNPRGLPTEESTDGMVTLLAIGLTILFIACINFTTLMIGQSTTRAREVGVRKVLGSGRRSLMAQFWVETGLLTAVALLLGVIGAELATPLFNDFTQRTVKVGFDGISIAGMIGLWALIVFAAGFYPALVISKFTPNAALRGEVNLGGRNRLRQSLVFIQYALSITLVAATLLMGNQLRYVLNSDLGYNYDRIISVEVPDLGNRGAEATQKMRAALADNPRITRVAGSACNFEAPWMVMNWLDDSREYQDVYVNVADAQWARMLDLKPIEGHLFREGTSDSTGMVINRAMAEYMGWDNPVGEQLPGEGWPEHQVIGVVEDFHFSTMHDAIRPLVLIIRPQTVLARSTGLDIQLNQWFTIQQVLFQIAPGDLQEAINQIQTTWEEVLPEQPFEFSFLDETIQERYVNDRRWISIVTASSSLAIVIALLGLLGMIGLEVARRTREIGIRKVLGASGRGIVVQLTRPMLRLVLLANVVAWPVAWLVIREWNSNYAFNAPIAPSAFLVAGAGTFVISFVVAGVMAWRASQTNPADILKVE